MNILLDLGKSLLSELSNYYNVDINRKALHNKGECVDIYLVLTGYKFIFKISCYVNKFFLCCLNLSTKEIIDSSVNYYKNNYSLLHCDYKDILSDLLVVSKNFINLNIS